MKPLDRRLLQHTRALRTLLAGSITIGALTALTTIAQAILLADVLARVISEHQGLSALHRPLVMLAVVIAVRGVLVWAGEELARRSAGRMVRQLRRALLEQALALGPRWRNRHPTHELSRLATTGVDGLDAYAARYLPQLVLATVVPMAMLAWLVTADPLSALIVALTLPLIPVFMALVGCHTQRLTRRRSRALDVLSGHFLDVICGLPTLKVFGRARAQAEAVRRTTADYRRSTMATLRVAFLSSLVLELLSTLSVALVAVSVGLRVVDGSMGLRTGLAVLILAPEAYLPLRALGTQFHASLDGLTAAEAVLAVLDLPVPATGTRTDLPSPADGEIVLRDVRVCYPDRTTPALDCHRLVIRPGRITVLIAPSGAGKTTVLQLLAALIGPDTGSITVGGEPLSAADPAWWRTRLGYLGQQPRLVAGTAFDNVALGNQDRPAPAIRRALELAAADEVVDSLPQGIDTYLGDNGASLSSGQRQRLGLARALLREAPLVLLDEPTAALDEATERRVMAGIRRHAVGRTVVIASHRTALLDIADDVIDLTALTAARAVAAEPAPTVAAGPVALAGARP